MKQHLPLIYQGLSGKMGNWVYYIRNDITYRRKPPRKRKKQSISQQIRQSIFRQAHLFGQSVNADPLLKAVYNKKAKPGSNAYLAAVSEYIKNAVEQLFSAVEHRLCEPCLYYTD